MSMRLMYRASWLTATFIAVYFVAAAADIPQPPAQTTRASASLNGVFSPRGFFNILVPLGEFQGVRAAKLDLKKSRITIDFEPGILVTQAEIRQIMVNAGYRPGLVSIEHLTTSTASEIGPGWMKIKHPDSTNRFVRWIKANF